MARAVTVSLLLAVALLVGLAAATPKYDYIVAGGGGAGCVIAAQLAAHASRPSVLLLEQGTVKTRPAMDSYMDAWYPHPEEPYERRYHAIPQEFAGYRKVYFPTWQGGPGGGTRIFAGTHVRGSREFYDLHMPSGYNYTHMLRHMKAAEDHYCYYLPEAVTGISQADCEAYHGQGGPMSIGTQNLAALSQPIHELVGMARAFWGGTADYNNPNTRVGASYEQVFKKLENPYDMTSQPTKVGTWQGFLSESFRLQHPNLRVVTGARVLRLGFSKKDPQRVIGVEYTIDNERSIVRALARFETFVSMGVVNTPRFLQANGIGPADLLQRIGAHVRAVNDAVGRGLSAHQGFGTGYKLNATTKHDPAFGAINVADFFYKTAVPGDLPADIQVQVLEGTYVDSVDPETPIPIDITGEVGGALARGDYPYVVGNEWQKYIGFLIYNVNPSVFGWVNATCTDPNKSPLIDFGWKTADLTGTYDLARLFTALGVTRGLMLNTPFAAKYDVKEVWPGDYYVNAVKQYYPGKTPEELQQIADGLLLSYKLFNVFHVTGSCRLGDCTDLDGRVKGVKNLRVCDNSLLPQPDGNPTATVIPVCMEIAERALAQHHHRHHRHHTTTTDSSSSS